MRPHNSRCLQLLTLSASAALIPIGIAQAQSRSYIDASQLVGACCSTGNTCTVVNASLCSRYGLVFLGVGTACSPGGGRCDLDVKELPSPPPPREGWAPIAISGDGATIITDGTITGGERVAAMWRASSGWARVELLPSMAGRPSGVSANGSRIVGQFRDPYSGNGYVWTAGALELTVIPSMNGQPVRPLGISPLGGIIVGEWGPWNNVRAAKWNGSGTGFTDLGAPQGAIQTPFASARACTDAAQTIGIMKISASIPARVAFRNLVALTPQGFTIRQSGAAAMSNDGSTIVGFLTTTDNQRHASRFNGTLADIHGFGFVSSEAVDCTGDGLTVVGIAERSAGECSFIWRSATGMVELREYLATRYTTLNLADWKFERVVGISDDGRRICGIDRVNATTVRPWLVSLPVARP